MRLYAVQTEIVRLGENLVEVTLRSLKRQNLQLEDRDVLALTSKIVACAEGRVVKLSDVKPSEEAKDLARKFSLQPEFAELVLREADKIYGGVEKAVLTFKDGALTANAGVDNKNAPEGFVVLWPNHTKEWVRRFREEIIGKTGKRISVLVVDSALAPLRLGTNGLALAVAGFKPVADFRGAKDAFGKQITITRHAVADDLASAVHLIIGEAAERTPIVLVRNAPIVLDDGAYNSRDMMISPKECIFTNALGLFHETLNTGKP